MASDSRHSLTPDQRYGSGLSSSPMQATFSESELSHRRRPSADVEGRTALNSSYSRQRQRSNSDSSKNRPRPSLRSVSSSLIEAKSQSQQRKLLTYVFGLFGCILLGLLLVLVIFPDISTPKPSSIVNALTRHTPIAPANTVRDINVRPPARQSAPGVAKDDVRYLAYFTHSGFHNQRVSLENALTLAKLLNRTLLVPPVRFGNAIPYISFDKLHLRLNQATKDGLLHCRNYDEYGILPRECIDFFDWTLVSWDLLVDTSLIEETMQQPIVDRWNGTLEWLEDNLGIREDEDIYAFKDDVMYQFRYYDSEEDTEPLEKFEKRIQIADLKLLHDYRLLHVGSLFGTSRLRTIEEDSWEVRSAFRQAMVFRNPALDAITNAMRDRLGGLAGYYGVHFRVGDGIFLKQARKNAFTIFRTLLHSKMKLSDDIVDQLVRLNAPELLASEAPPTFAEEQTVHEEVVQDREAAHEAERIPAEDRPAEDDSPAPRLRKRASNSRPQRPGAYKHAFPKPIPPIRQRSDSPLDSSLKCRGPLYPPDSPYIKLNAPLFLATDSRIPTADPNLAIFFKSFPCTFVLSDFGSSPYNSQPIESLHQLEAWRNMDDHVPLAPFLYPIVDMMVAARARAIVGTPQSTFSRFAIDVLHQSYHDWPIVERG